MIPFLPLSVVTSLVCPCQSHDLQLQLPFSALMMQGYLDLIRPNNLIPGLGLLLHVLTLKPRKTPVVILKCVIVKSTFLDPNYNSQGVTLSG